MTMMIIIYWFLSKGRVPNQNVDSEGTEYWFWRHRTLFLKAYPSCMFIKCTNKMGRLRRMLILKKSPDQQMVSIGRPETTNWTVTEHHPHQQMCWSTKWVGHPDCSFWHPFTFLVTPTSTKWATGPILFLGVFLEKKVFLAKRSTFTYSMSYRFWKLLVQRLIQAIKSFEASYEVSEFCLVYQCMPEYARVCHSMPEYARVGGTKNTNFQNSMGALSNPISFAIRISKQFLCLF